MSYSHAPESAVGAILAGGYVFLSEMLRHELVGLLQIEENRYEVYFGNLLLGEVNTDWMTMTRVR